MTPRDEPTAARGRITWLGHASVLVELGGARVLTDPALTPRLAHLRRHHTPPPIEPPDAILISHVHMDHLHVPSLRQFGRDVQLIAPAGAGAFLRRRGFRQVRETRAGATTAVNGLTIETVPAVHDRRRGPQARVTADAVGYVMRAGTSGVYFPGDTALFAEMADIAPVDVALLPIWGWGPTLGDGHLDPTGAVRAAELIQPGLVLPIHWGTYSPVSARRRPPTWLGDPVRRFEAEMSAAGAADRLGIVAPGGELLLPAGATATP